MSDSYVGLDQFADPLARILSDRSAEPISTRSGDARDFSSFDVVQSNLHGFFTNNLTGAGSEGAVRGNPDNDDQIFITQIKLTYNIGSSGRSRAKFR